ncbi:MAG: ribosome maturation factor RimM [Thermoanaerobaculales bacterium]|nr:ribosome maturation factor RimM [Thermoanaerobaculales bacterium]
MVEPADRSWLVIGRVVKPHGVQGDLLVEIVTDFPERLTEGVVFGVGGEDGPRSHHEVVRARVHKGRWLLSVRGLRDRDAADSWRGHYLYLPEQSLDELPEGFVYEHHLVGLACRSPLGEDLGEVRGLDRGPGQQRLVVRRGRREFLVPYVPEIVTAVDLEAGTVTVDAPPGLLDDDAVMA